MEITELIDKLEAMASQAKKVPITGRSMIDAERLYEIVDQLRLAVPRSLQEADEVLERREQIINRTVEDARRLRITAEKDARDLVHESELTKSAKKRGDEIVAEAESKAERLIAAAKNAALQERLGADKYAQDVLAELEEQALGILNTIHASQRVLAPNPEISQSEREVSADSR